MSAARRPIGHVRAVLRPPMRTRSRTFAAMRSRLGSQPNQARISAWLLFRVTPLVAASIRSSLRMMSARESDATCLPVKPATARRRVRRRDRQDSRIHRRGELVLGVEVERGRHADSLDVVVAPGLEVLLRFERGVATEGDRGPMRPGELPRFRQGPRRETEAAVLARDRRAILEGPGLRA